MQRKKKWSVLLSTQDRPPSSIDQPRVTERATSVVCATQKLHSFKPHSLGKGICREKAVSDSPEPDPDPAKSQVGASSTPQYTLEQSVLLGRWFLLSPSEFRNSTSVRNEPGQAPAQPLKPPNSSARTRSAELAWGELEQWPQGLHFLSSNRNQRFSPSSRSESLIQDSFPGGDGAMSCPILTKTQQSDFPFDRVPIAGSLADRATTSKLS